LLAKPIEVVPENDTVKDALNTIFGKSFCKTIKNLGEDALNCGISYLFPYADGDGTLKFRRFKGYEILPFWKDDDHTELDAFARIYNQEVYEGSTKKMVKRVEWYKPEGVQHFTFESGSLKPDDEDITPYLVIGSGESNAGYNWGRVPLVAFKANSEELPLIQRVKSLQDALNTIMSDYMDNMQETPRNSIIVIKNYDGQDLAEFRRNLAALGAVKVRDDGEVKVLSVEVNSENYKSIITILKKAIIENGRGLDTKDDRMATGTPNQMNIQSMYNDIDLDADEMESEFQDSLEQLMYFVNMYLQSRGYQQTNVDFKFNRDVMINETDTINNCQKSKGIISDETILANHPWVTDRKDEMERLKKEQEEASQSMMGDYPIAGPKQPAAGE
jgi:SPP1 family phage portal protein